MLSLAGFFVIFITCLARSSTKQSAEFVWTQFSDESGWSPGISFLTGLISPNYMYSGIDGAIHLAEECKDPERVVPRALLSTLIIGFITSFIFAVSMTYCIGNFATVVSTPTGYVYFVNSVMLSLTQTNSVPIYEIWIQATRSHTAATVFMVLLFIAAVVALIAVQQTASRLTWSLGRDNAFFGSQFLGRMHSSLQVPVWSLIFNNFVVFIIGFIYLGSSTAFNAFIGTGLILQQITFAFPAVLLLYRRRSAKYLPVHRPFKLPRICGWTVNIVTVTFAVIVVVFYNFPVVLPVTGSNMSELYPHISTPFWPLNFTPDYTSVVLGIMGIFAAINWFVHANKSYRGPRLYH